MKPLGNITAINIMKIGIDISQTAFEGTGVAEYTKKLVETILKLDAENEYLLFFAGFSQN